MTARFRKNDSAKWSSAIKQGNEVSGSKVKANGRRVKTQRTGATKLKTCRRTRTCAQETEEHFYKLAEGRKLKWGTKSR
ncbi:hypothetical protein POVCU2_0036430 [Plasmodium ovale curtisi]|uniref:Uncharacterized protein n=1 Tax=Plasmodium ovale curtisi TaxID=864141 RepID=A0A1A8X8Y6_PLAOA|nr:hypothetical protein POVCU2_0036430 [Plasmodium ovale curtisi]SBT01069.1 hypothetical protein POVCU1_064380 [Plasmodium ovale curtisi]